MNVEKLSETSCEPKKKNTAENHFPFRLRGETWWLHAEL